MVDRADPGADADPSIPVFEYAATIDRPGGQIAYAEYGDPRGSPVVFCHGTPGSRVAGELLAAPAEEAGVRLLVPDRPGYGQSDPVREVWTDDARPPPGRTLAGRARMYVEFVDGLDLGAFGVVGFSGGGPYALALASLVPDRVAGVAVASGATPPAAPGRTPDVARPSDAVDCPPRDTERTGEPHPSWSGSSDREESMGPLEELFGEIVDFVFGSSAPAFPGFHSKLYRRPPEVLVEWYGDPDRFGEFEVDPAGVLKANLLEAFDQSPAAGMREHRLVERPWGFDLEDVAVPVVLLYGDADEITPEAGGQYLAERLPAATPGTVVEEDHLSTLLSTRETVLEHAAPGLQLDVSGSEAGESFHRAESGDDLS